MLQLHASVPKEVHRVLGAFLCSTTVHQWACFDINRVASQNDRSKLQSPQVSSTCMLEYRACWRFNELARSNKLLLKRLTSSQRAVKIWKNEVKWYRTSKTAEHSRNTPVLSNDLFIKLETTSSTFNRSFSFKHTNISRQHRRVQKNSAYQVNCKKSGNGIDETCWNGDKKRQTTSG